MWSILEPYRDTLVREKELLADAAGFFGELGLDEAQDRLRGATAALERPFLVVVAGEYNSGKSSLINALLGEEVLEVGVLPTTDRITLVCHGTDRGKAALDDHVVEIRHPAPFLKEANLVDTPGTNSLVQDHQRISEDYIPNADLILFVTSTDRPLTESEHRFLKLIGGRWKRTLALILNKADLVGREQLDEIVDYLRTQSTQMLGGAPRVFPVSVRRALEADRDGRDDDASGLAALREYVFEKLGNKKKVVLKLGGPLDVLDELLGVHVAGLDALEKTLRDETQGLDHVVRNVRERATETAERNVRALERVDAVIDRVRVRAYEFLDETLTLGALIRYRLSRKKLEDDFRQHLVADGQLADRMDEILSETVGELVRETRLLWNDALAFVDDQIRERERRSELVGRAGGAWIDRRREIRLGIRSAIDHNLKDFNLDLEAARIQEAAGKSLVQFLGLEVMGGGLAAALLTATAYDLTGIVLGIVLAGLGLVVIPARRRQAKTEIGRRLDTLGRSLKGALGDELEGAVQRSVDDIDRALDPYTSLCRAERERLGRERTTIEELRARARELRLAIE